MTLMDLLKKAVFLAGAASFMICSLFLNGMGGLAILTVSDEKYSAIGVMLLCSVLMFVVSFVMLFFKKTPTDLISLLFNAAGTVLYALPVNALTSISGDSVPKENIEILTNRIYPSVIVSVLFALYALLSLFSEERRLKRQAKRDEKNRELRSDERIV